MLGLNEEQVENVQITNPIELGDGIEDKAFILDVKVVLNNETYINLEMQVLNEKNWEERSLSYLSGAFDQLYRGQDYYRRKRTYERDMNLLKEEKARLEDEISELKRRLAEYEKNNE